MKDILSPLHLAVVNNDLATLERLLDEKTSRSFAKTTEMIVGERPRDSRVFVAGDFFYPDKNELLGPDHNFDKGSTPVHFAAALGNTEALSLFKAHKANLKSKDGIGASPLNLAALGGHLEAVKLLLTTKQNVNDATKTRKSIRFYDTGTTPLHAALSSGNFELIELLIEHGADPNAKTKYGCDAYFFAARGGNIQSLNLLKSLGVHLSKLSDYYNFPLLEAIRKRHIEMVEALLRLGSSTIIPPRAKTPLVTATENNFLKIRQLLLDYGAEPLGDHGLIAAARRNDTTYIRNYVKLGKDLNVIQDGATALMHASAKGYLDSVQLLIDLGANLNINSNGTALHWAISNNHHPIMLTLLDAEIDCSLVDNYGNTVLTKMLRRKFPNRITIVKKMIALGANPHTVSKGNSSAMSLAKDGDEELALLFESISKDGAIDLSYSEPSESKILNALKADYKWQNVFNTLFDELVPPSGPSNSVQGNLLRCIGKLTDEAFRNGNINWDDKERFIEMVDYLKSQLLDGTFDEEKEQMLTEQLRRLTHYKKIPFEKIGSPHYIISEAVIDWCFLHKQLIVNQSN